MSSQTSASQRATKQPVEGSPAVGSSAGGCNTASASDAARATSRTDPRLTPPQPSNPESTMASPASRACATAALDQDAIRVVPGIVPASNLPNLLGKLPFLGSATPVLNGPLLDHARHDRTTKAQNAQFCCGLWGSQADIWVLGMQIKHRSHLWLANGRDAKVQHAIYAWNAKERVAVTLSDDEDCLFHSFDFRLPPAMRTFRPELATAPQKQAFMEEALQTAVAIRQGRMPLPSASPRYSHVEPAQVCIVSSSAD